MSEEDPDVITNDQVAIPVLTPFSGSLFGPCYHQRWLNQWDVGQMIIQEKATLRQMELRLIDSKTEVGECLYFLAVQKQRERIAELYEIEAKVKVYMN